MWATIATVLGILLLVVLVVGITYFVRMRARTPWVLDRVRHFARRVANPLMLRKAGKLKAMASVIEHVGRVSGTAYRTPVEAIATEDGYAIVYGPRTDWLKNVLANGSATIVHEGHAVKVDRPEVIPIHDADAYYTPALQKTHERFRIGECLRLRRVELATQETADLP